MIRLPVTETEFRNALVDAAELGSKKTLIEIGYAKPYIKLREAYRRYGQAIVRRWIQEGLIHLIKDGPRNASLRIDALEIASIAKSCNRSTYIPITERKPTIKQKDID